MITSATNLAKAHEAVEAYLVKQPFVTDLQQMTVPLLANVLVLGWLAAETDDMYLAANHNVLRAEAMAMLARDGR